VEQPLLLEVLGKVLEELVLSEESEQDLVVQEQALEAQED